MAFGERVGPVGVGVGTMDSEAATWRCVCVYVCVWRGLQRGTDFALMHPERMDQFALGVVVFECVLWRRPAAAALTRSKLLLLT